VRRRRDKTGNQTAGRIKKVELFSIFQRNSN